MKEDELEWHFTHSTDNRRAHGNDFRDKYSPRMIPLHLMVTVGTNRYEMKEPVEYLIGFTNGPIAVGTAKSTNLSEDQPLTMQFGNWRSQLKNEMYLGCSVLVKSYYPVVQNNDHGPKTVKPMIGENSNQKDMFFRCHLSSTTVAADWAITKKPQIERTLGFVKDFRVIRNKIGELVFEGIVFDQENNEDVEVYENQWPSYIKKKVDLEMPVLLNWILLDEPHEYYFAFANCATIFPDRGDLKVDGRMEKAKWLGWVDTKLKGLNL